MKSRKEAILTAPSISLDVLCGPSRRDVAYKNVDPRPLAKSKHSSANNARETKQTSDAIRRRAVHSNASVGLLDLNFVKLDTARRTVQVAILIFPFYVWMTFVD
jgi:hypothetical protein